MARPSRLQGIDRPGCSQAKQALTAVNPLAAAPTPSVQVVFVRQRNAGQRPPGASLAFRSQGLAQAVPARIQSIPASQLCLPGLLSGNVSAGDAALQLGQGGG